MKKVGGDILRGGEKGEGEMVNERIGHLGRLDMLH